MTNLEMKAAYEWAENKAKEVTTKIFEKPSIIESYLLAEYGEEETDNILDYMYELEFGSDW